MANQLSKNAKKLATKLGIKEPHKVYIGKDGFVRTSARDTLSANLADEGAQSRGAAGGCNQTPDRVPDK